MALYFGKAGLRDDNDFNILISKKELLQACLSHPFDTVNAARIIFESIERLTGENIKPKNGYNQSMLFCWLERKIHHDTRYLEAKARIMEKDEQTRAGERQYRQENIRSFSEDIEKKERKKMLRYYRCRSNRE